jgi:tetratricopeptide (TPR) repeat protein
MTSKCCERARVVFLCLVLGCGFVSCLNASEKAVSSGISHYMMGVIHEDKGDLGKAVDEYRQALKSDPDSPLIHLRLASTYIKSALFDKAVEECKEVVSLNPQAAEPHALLALIYSLQKKLDLATTEYEQALEKASRSNPKDIQIQKSLGEVYFWHRDFESAEKVYRMILELSPQDAQAHFYLGIVYEEQKKTKEATEEFRAAVNIDPEYAEALNSLGYIYAEQGINLDEAQTLIKKALELDFNNPAYIDSLGWVYFKKGDYEAAIKELERAIGFMEDPVIYDHLGDAYFKNGILDKARESWEKSFKLDEKQESVKNKLQGLEKTQ